CEAWYNSLSGPVF
nr:immunoglobulin light chain junction region [Macaca mulatta]